MSRRPLSLRRRLAALACAAPLLAPTAAHSDTCSGLSLTTGTSVGVGTTPNAVAVGDFDRDGLMDVAVVNSGSNNVTIRLGNGSAGPGSPIATGAGSSPVDIAAGDVDQDGILDLVVAFGGSPQARVLRGLGTGGFDNSSSAFSLNAIPTRIYLGRFTADADLDLVVVSQAGQRLLLYAGAAGITFGGSALTDISLSGFGQRPFAATVLDFNRNGLLDLAVVVVENVTNVAGARVYTGNGAGVLTAGPEVTLETNAAPRDIAAGDINRDGWPDLVTANSGASTAWILFNSSGLSLSPQPSVLVGGVPLRVALVDLDHDGVLDLAALDDSATPRLAAFEGLTSGPPWFDPSAAAASLPATGVRGLAVADLTADGRADFVTTLSTTNQVIGVENESGTPCVRSSFAGAPRSYAAGDGPVSTARGDFDGDGRQDLVVAAANDGTIRILRNVNGEFVTSTTMGPFFPPPRAVATGDLDMDGDVDLVVAQGDVGSGQVQVFLGLGTGAFFAGAIQPAGQNTSALVIDDFDGNGAPDVAATSEGSGFVYMFLGNGVGGLGAGIQTGVGAAPRALVAGFFNTDANLDLAVANFGSNTVSILAGNGNGSFTPGPVLPVGTNPQGIAAAHLDGDGRLDVVTADNGAGQVSVILRDGAGGFQSATTYTVGTNPTAVALVNLAGDPKLDIAVTTASMSGDQTLTVLTNNGAGGFATPGSDHPVRQSPQAITPIDADTDGLLDLAVPCRSADAVVILIHRPPGPPVLQAAPDFDVRDKPRAAVAGDFDGNGTLDLAVANSGDNSVSLMAGDGLGGLSQYTTLPVAAAEAIVSADFNRDGKLDLAVSSPGGGTPSVAIFFGAGGGLFGAPSSVNVGGTPDDLVAGDFDGDGKIDLALCDKTLAGSVRILRNDPLGTFTFVASTAVGDKPTAIVAADFDRDGDVDLVVANSDSNNVMFLSNTSGSFGVTQTLALAGGDTSPFSLAAGDFDGNGTLDLAAAAFANDRLHTYLNQAIPLTPFVTSSTFNAPYLLQSVVSADLNLDGKPDLVAVASGLSVLRGRGGMDFDPAETVVARHAPVAAVTGDFDRDGRPDVVVVNEGSDDVTMLRSTACSALRLEVSLQPIACDDFSPPPFPVAAEVKAFDDGGNLAICATNTVLPSIVPGTGDPSATLSGPGASGVALASGVAAFSGPTGLSIDKAGRRYRLQFGTGGIAPVQSRSFTLGPGTTQILGPDSVCPSSFGLYSSSASFDSYTWTLDPPASPFAYTPSASVGSPPFALGSHVLNLVGRVDGCVITGVNRSIYLGDLASVTLSILGASSVCVDCIGGTARAIETGGGTAVTRQWGYRTVSLGPITPIPGETGETYVLKGTSFPGPGTYFVVVTTTPAVTCGTPKISNEWMVTVDNSLLNGEVRHLAASSRGNAASGENRLLWVNTTGSADEIKIRWNKAPDTMSDCTPPLSHDSLPVDGEDSISLPPPNTKASYPHLGLELDTTYCYSVFVRVGGGWSPGRTVKARPFDSAGRVKWAYATGGTAVTPPTVSAVGIMAMSNDRTVHALTRDSNGGEWPTNWVPTELVGVAHSRSPVVPFDPPLLTLHDTVLFAADDASPEGFLHAVDARTGIRPWAAKPQTKPTMGAPGGMFMRFGGVRDLLVVGTRHDTNPNALRGLSVTDGSLVEEYTGAGSAGQIGPILGSPAIGYPNLVYFASRQFGAGDDTLFCVEVRTSAPFFAWRWSRNLGDIETSPVLRGGRIYVGTVGGTIYSLDAATGLDDHTFTPSPADGRVKGFLFPDRRTGSDDLIFATDTKVWSISDDGVPNGPDEMSLNWQWSVGGLNPSVVLYWPGTNFVYVGSRNGELYELDFTNPITVTWKLQVLGSGQGQVGAPSLDIGVTPELLIVGSEPGVLYGVTVPF